MKSVTINSNDAGQRVDKFLQKHFATLPKSMMFKQIRKKNIKVNRKRCTPEQVLLNGDVIDLYLPDDMLAEKKKHYDFLFAPKDLSIIYEDENIILMDKKQGELCHPDGKEYVNTLVASMKRYLYDKGEYKPEEENSFTPSLANRIDRNTGGIVIGAKNYQSLKILNQKIKDREIDKLYLTVTEGVFDKKSDVLVGWLIKGRSDYLGIHGASHIGNLLRTFVDEQHHQVCLWMVGCNGIGNILHQDGLTGLRLSHDECTLSLTDR